MALSVAFATSAQAQSPPSPALAQAPAASAQLDPQQDIVVIAPPQEQGSIDRTTYTVKDNAEARALSALDLLSRVPAVDVSPSGQVRLIGRSGVTILINGQEVPNANAFLRAMQGSEVAKIEVVTNPSAQFSARGTGGIINIVTRRAGSAGLGGSVTGNVGSHGGVGVRASPTWRKGKVTLGGSIGASREGSRLRSEDERVAVPPGEEANRIERERSRGESDAFNASLRASVDIAPRQSLSLSAMAMEAETRMSARSDIVENGSPFEERQTLRSDNRMRRVAADYRREGSRAGEVTTLSASHTSFRLGTKRQFVTEGEGGTSDFRLRNRLAGKSSIVKADHVRPAGERRLSIGGQYERNGEDNRQQAVTSSPPADPVATADEFEGSWSEASAYATYQFPFWGNKLLAGARVESRWFDIAGAADDPERRTHVFPSLHVERKLGERLTANLSYSSRIGWPGLAQFDPRLRFNDPETARAGNPLLRPEKTHSLELKLMARAGRHEADLTGYFQRTRDLRTERVALEGEVLVSRPVNLGTRTSIGGSLNVRGPVAKGLRYTVTADLARDRFGEGGVSGVDGEGTRYGTSLQLEYRDGTEGKAGADLVRVTGRYTGPSETGLTRISPLVRADASWSHGLTDRLAAVLTASHAFRPVRITSMGPDLISRTSFRASGPTFNIALTYSLSPSGQ